MRGRARLPLALERVSFLLMLTDCELCSLAQRDFHECVRGRQEQVCAGSNGSHRPLRTGASTVDVHLHIRADGCEVQRFIRRASRFLQRRGQGLGKYVCTLG